MNYKILPLVLLTQVTLTSCQTKNVANGVLEAKKSAENICEPPSLYIGNHVTGDSRVYDLGDYKMHEWFRYNIIPAKYEWIDGKHEGTSIEYHLLYPQYRTETHKVEIPVATCPPEGVYLDCDEKTKIAKHKFTKQILVKPLRIEKCEVPFLYQDGRTRIVVEPSKVETETRVDWSSESKPQFSINSLKTL